MLARRLAHAAAVLAIASSLACATAADRQAREAARQSTLARLPANAPAGVLAAGRWSGSVTGEAPMRPNVNWGWGTSGATRLSGAAGRVTRELAVEVSAWRDSARLTILREGVAGRQLPRDVAIVGDTMSFALTSVIGWNDVRCRLVETRDARWTGPCRTADGQRVASMTLLVPRAKTASR